MTTVAPNRYINSLGASVHFHPPNFPSWVSVRDGGEPGAPPRCPLCSVFSSKQRARGVVKPGQSPAGLDFGPSIR